MSTNETLRYSRQITLEEIGESGQKRLKEAKVLIVGMGGLGCPAALYLAAAGVGTLGIIDPDQVDMSNLHRQILYRSEDIGRHKVDVAKRELHTLNPQLQLYSFPCRLQASNCREIFSSYDIVLDATDNFETRYLINDACFLLNKTNVFASVTKFEGRLSVFSHGGPCYRCLYPTPPQELVLNCSEEGVLGVVPGILGTLQALEAIKQILGITQPEYSNSVLLVDLLGMSFKSITIQKNPNCPLCGLTPSITSLSSQAPKCQTMKWISPLELSHWISQKHPFHLIDVREPHETEKGTLRGAQLIPLSRILTEDTLHSEFLESDAPKVLFCQSGKRSQQAALKWTAKGVKNIYQIEKG
ncbi:MAG: molybdopterin-synthase adenylyltransferase MoeB, partial [Deltaproteobacteria bacterium]